MKLNEKIIYDSALILANKAGFIHHRNRKKFWKEWDEMDSESFPELGNNDFFFNYCNILIHWNRIPVS